MKAATIKADKRKLFGKTAVVFELTLTNATYNNAADYGIPTETYDALITSGFVSLSLTELRAICDDNDAIKSVQTVLQQMRADGIIA